VGNNGHDELHGAGGMDRLDGGNGNDLLGGPGTDTLLGGTGNDRYIVDSPTEVLVEPISNSGIDTIESGVSRTLGDRFENLVLTGDGAIDGTGNAAGNSLTGNTAANHLNGGPDSDQLDGGPGDDTLEGGPGSDLMDGDSGNGVYYVDGLGDLITEQSGAGQDTVFSAVSYVVPAEVETLRLTGGAGIDGAGTAWQTPSLAMAAPTRWPAERATTGWRAVMAPTCWPAAAATTCWKEVRAPTAWMAVPW
jgi:Ca2+-binding RTX toxin-like protein